MANKFFRTVARGCQPFIPVFAAMFVWAAVSAHDSAAQMPGMQAMAPSRSDTAPVRNTKSNAQNVTAPDSPRVVVEEFLALVRAGQFEAASDYLIVADRFSNDRAKLAREFKAVLDRHLVLNTDDISPLSVGDTTDGLTRSQEQLGTILLPDGRKGTVRLQQTPEDTAIAWRFTANTVQSIPLWYANLPDVWLLDRLPAVFVRTGPFDILWWQWLALPLLLALAVLIGWIASKVAFNVLQRVVNRTASQWDDAVLASIERPLATAMALAAFAVSLSLISLYPVAHDNVFRCIRASFFVVFFWALWRLIDVARQVLSSSRWAQASTSSRALLPLGARVIKVVVFAIALVGLLSLLGYPVASLLAGLGLGGLALALAAQKTVENLFGAFSIGVDQPFREGDFVRVEDFVGTVEAVGLRATRFRTLDRTLVSMPNGRLADMRLESLSARDRMRLATTIGLVYQTTTSQMREVLAGFERVLRAHPKIWPDAVVVKFKEFGASSLDIEIMAWFQVPAWSDFQVIRQDILLQFMEVVEAAGSDFAFPTRTIHVASIPERAGDAPLAAMETSTAAPQARSAA